jgi:MoaA/NifB/PqqE/SkfB family radical SAM enzyme
MRPDIVELITLFYNKCHPAIINIPTNGILWQNIVKKVPQIAENCPKASLVINLSVDQVGEKHNEIRGVKGNWDLSMKAWKGLKEAQKKHKNLTLGIHTVISNFNVKDFPEFHKELLKLEPDSYITEIAEERIELDTVGTGITPSFEDYSRAINTLLDDMKKMFKDGKYKGVAKVAAAFRMQYYEMVKRWLKEKKQIIPCYAGFASVQFSPEGNVWSCCIQAKPLGNLRDAGYDFKKIWRSSEMDKARKRIKNKECSCPLANASYTNMLFDLKTLTKAGFKVIGK